MGAIPGRVRISRLAAIFLLAALIGGSALSCGGESETTEAVTTVQLPPPGLRDAKFQRYVDRICRVASTKLKEFEGPRPQVQTLVGVAANTQEFLETIEPRPHFVADYNRFLRYLRLREAKRALLYKDGSQQEHAQQVRRFKLLTAKAATVAQQLGLPNCPYN